MAEKLPLVDITPPPAPFAAADERRFGPDEAGPGKRLRLHFSLALAGGDLIDGTFGGEPASLTVGDGNLPEPFEKLLLGLRAGASERFELSPETAFGPHRADNVQRFPRAQFAAELDLRPGVVLNFQDAGGNDLPGVVVALGDREVTVDFNHPLAGRALIFRVELLSVEEP